MELLFVTVIGAGIGLVLEFVLPKRHSYGLLLLPGVDAIVTSAVWAGLVWLGWKFDGGWIWVVALVAGGLASLIVSLVASRVRERQDAHLLHELTGGRA